ncbi:MAG: hypothetical protein AD742_14940 [Methylibium sp. NZG]|nr:MAG: hypothetical protein AD742_14940 [Methylibium sp. NZG]
MSSVMPLTWVSRFVETIRVFRRRLLAALSWNIVFAVALQGSTLISTILVARILGLEAFGAYSVLVSTVMTAAAIAQSGTGVVATKFVAESAASDPGRVGRVLDLCRAFAFGMGVCVAALLFGLAELLSVHLLGRPELVELVRTVAIAAFFQMAVSYQIGALQGFGAFRELGLASVGVGLWNVATTAAGAALGGLSGALVGFVAASALRSVTLGLTLGMVRRRHGIPRPSAHLARHEIRRIWTFALPTGLAGMISLPCQWLVTVLLARMQDGLVLVALFAVANQVRLAVLQIPSMLNAVSFSVLSRLIGERQGKGFREVFWSNFAMTSLFSILAVGVLLLAAGPVLSLYGPSFAAAQGVLVVLLLSAIPEMLGMSLYQLVQTSGRMWHSLFLIAMPRDYLYLGASALLMPELGAMGAAYAYLMAQILALVSTGVVAQWCASHAVPRPL